MSERPKSPDRARARENEVVRFLARVRQYEQDPAKCEALQTFVKEQQALADAANSDRGNIKFAITMARVYARAGYLAHAFEELEATRWELGQGGEHRDLLEYVHRLMDAIFEELN